MNEFEAYSRAAIVCQMLHPFAEKIMVSGSLRRFVNSQNIDIVLSTPNVLSLNQLISSNIFDTIKKIGCKKVLKVIVSDEKTTITTHLPSGQALCVSLCVSSDFYRLVAMTTGTEQYAQKLANLWEKKGFIATRGGLCHFRNKKIVAPEWSNEKDFFTWLGVKYIEPNERFVENFQKY
jgi:DNA polymerase/3'-5' exonuclease PolX